MLGQIGLAYLKDIIGIMLKKKGFLEKSEAERINLIQELYGKQYPESLTAYMAKFDAEDFMTDVEVAIESFEIEPKHKKNAFMDAIAGFVSAEFGYRLDRLESSFFFEPLDDRRETLRHLFPGDSDLSYTMRDIFIQNTYQELTQKAYHLLSVLKEPYTIVVQTPVEMDDEMRKMIRQAFNDKQEYVFVEFQVNPQIIGGMRVFENGKVIDHSWLAKVQAITQITI